MSGDHILNAILESTAARQLPVTQDILFRIEQTLADNNSRSWEVLVARAYLKGVSAGLDRATLNDVCENVRKLLLE